jgi:hypothetical protein
VSLTAAAKGYRHQTNVSYNNASFYGGGVNFDARLSVSHNISGMSRRFAFAMGYVAMVAANAAHLPGVIALFSAIEESSQVEMREMELMGNIAGVGGGAVYWSHARRSGERVKCGNCTFSGNTAPYGADNATEFIAWDVMPTSRTLAALNRTKPLPLRSLRISAARGSRRRCRKPVGTSAWFRARRCPRLTF